MLQLMHCICKPLPYLSFPSKTIPDRKISYNSKENGLTQYTVIHHLCCSCAAYAAVCSNMIFFYFELFSSFRPRKKYPLQKVNQISAHFPNFCLAASELFQIAMQLQLLQLQNKTNFFCKYVPKIISGKVRKNDGVKINGPATVIKKLN